MSQLNEWNATNTTKTGKPQ